MHTLIFDRHDINLEYDNNSLIVRQPGHTPRSVPLTHIQKVVCLHNVHLTTSLLGQLWKRGIDFITLNSRYSECSFGVYADQTGLVQRRCRQYEWQRDDQASLVLAKRFCRYRAICYSRLCQSGGYSEIVDACLLVAQAMTEATSLDQLRGMEGALARRMFGFWRERLPESLGFEKRQRRPALDPVNALLSLTFTLVHHEAVRQCLAHGLDPWLGFYHRVTHGRHSLACDLMEPVRPFCEQWAVSLFCNGVLDARYFTRAAHECMLGKQGRAVFYREVQTVMPQWRRKLKANARWVGNVLESGEREHNHAA